MLSDAIPRKPVHNAAEWRKRLRRELLRVGATNVSLYIDGPRGIVRLRFPSPDRELHLPVGDALRLLRALSDGVGVAATVDALTHA